MQIHIQCVGEVGDVTSGAVGVRWDSCQFKFESLIPDGFPFIHGLILSILDMPNCFSLRVVMETPLKVMSL